MKKLLLILLCLPLIGFSQKIFDKKNKEISEIDISKFDREIITVVGSSLPKKVKGSHIFYGEKNEKGKEIGFKIRKKSSFYDGESLIKVVNQNDIISYFEKWGLEYTGSDVKDIPMLINGIMITIHETTLTFRNQNNNINPNVQSILTDKKDGVNKKENAIEELKRLKELLDLELITKEEYEKKSKELKKIILN